MSDRKKRGTLGCMLCAVVLLGGGLFFFAPSLLCRRTCDVDINSGRLRQGVWVGFMFVPGKVEETVISQNMTYDSSLSPDWRRVRSEPVVAFPEFIPWHQFSTTAKYAEVPGQAEMLRLLWKGQNVSIESKRKLVDEIVSLWKQTGRDEEATRLLIRMFDAKAIETKAKGAVFSE